MRISGIIERQFIDFKALFRLVDTTEDLRMIDKDLALSNVIAQQRLEGLVMADDEIERGRSIIDDDLFIDDTIDQINQELSDSNRPAVKSVNG